MNWSCEIKAKKRFEMDLQLTAVLYETRLHISINKSSDKFSMLILVNSAIILLFARAIKLTKF